MSNQGIWVAALAALVASCVIEQPTIPPAAPAPEPEGPSKPPDVDGGGSETFFEARVYHDLVAECGQCHRDGAQSAPLFLSTAPEDGYDQIKHYKGGVLAAQSEANLIVLKDKHTGPKPSDAVKALVTEWLDKHEYAPPPGEPPPEPPSTPGPSLNEALENFANCMDFADWDEAQIDVIPLIQAAGGIDCQTCHENDRLDGGVLLSSDAVATFKAFQSFPAILKLVNPAIDGAGAFSHLEYYPRLVDKGFQDPGCDARDVIDLDPIVDAEAWCHPSYDLPPEIDDALELFVLETLALSESLDCALQQPNN